ncbi:4a-hydroxytetrahydrobiopterin dehydratase [Gilvimarinus chinensis]|uniref:4a-hydroxytetrahydrobiopterin dehydratase n=1 Tax=Gilvimarinus chinensis TaxID=396005 RepID=UPI00037D765E|nr:4a-hydroxytetrahydrobiopterin dehydratase [Gilvimarinus chinensis]
MSELYEQQCEACRADAPKLNDKEIADLLKALPDWSVVEYQDVPVLTRQFTFSDFAKALAFTNKVGDLAEAHQHHPAITTEWGKVKVQWWTHKIKGLHRNDFVMAAKTNRCL